VTAAGAPVPALFDYDAAKPPWYFRAVRADYVAAMPGNPAASILELGCSDGGTGALALASGKCGRYVGIEIAPEAAERARARLTQVIVGDVERMALDLPEASFDALVISEVLEHLVDPWSVVARLGALLRPGGLLFASSPNVAHLAMVRRLLRGRWDLEDTGVMDRTHLRWFTPATFRAMFEEAGFQTLRIGPIKPFGTRKRLISRVTGGRFDHLMITQIDYRGRRR
jgi:2-polyprenyl-3-methyl-5-hydroxy-6-metoxy-1,4-benzoquinol methylase